MSEAEIIRQLNSNIHVFEKLFCDVEPIQQKWKPETSQWSLLEVLCHLCDEEREDFRARVQHTLETPLQPLPSIDPVGWVSQRQYWNSDFVEKLEEFVSLRSSNLKWLYSLQNPPWLNVHVHPKFGPMSARYFLVNWLAHDYLHIRQITRLKFQYIVEKSGTDSDYAGRW